MTTLINLILLPLRAPMVLVLLGISTYLGLHWSQPGSWADAGSGGITNLIWSAECVQALVVVVVCTMPDLLLRRIATVMAASRVASLVVTLLLVITGGLYLLHLEVLSNVLILASTVMLARLDLVRLRVVPPPFAMTVILSVLVLGGITLGRSIEVQMRPLVSVPEETRAPAEHRSSAPAGAEASAKAERQPPEPQAERDGKATGEARPTAEAQPPRPPASPTAGGVSEGRTTPEPSGNAGERSPVGQ